MSPEQPQARREMPLAETVSLAGMVNYQEGSVVSRTLINRPAATITLFAFDEGQGLSEHTAPFDALADRKSTRLNSSHATLSRMPSSA